MQDIINFIQNNPEQVAALTALCAIIISFFSIVIIALLKIGTATIIIRELNCCM